MLLWSVIQNLWDAETNPDGFVSLGVAENTLMHDELLEYIHKNVQILSRGLTYNDGGAGSRAMRTAMARFLNRKFNTIVPIEKEHICITNGVTSAIEHLSWVLCDPGDVFLLGQPHYGAFVDDISLRPGTEVVKVAFEGADPLGLEGVKCYEDAVIRCQKQGKKVKGLMLCNPHNPLGRCYPRKYIEELIKICQRYQIHLVSDEIYALSVFRETDEDDETVIPFTSLASIPCEGLIDPALTHILYGMSKDFGANGLRLGAIISQHNSGVHQALIPVSINSYASSLTEAAATSLLNDDEFVDWYVVENQKRLRKSWEVVLKWAEEHDIEYAKGVNTAFFLWVNLGKVYQTSMKQGRITANAKETSKIETAPGDKPSAPNAVDKQAATDDIDALTSQALLDQKVFLAAGTAFGSEKPGWFRIVFSHKEEQLREGLSRIEKALGLSDE